MFTQDEWIASLQKKNYYIETRSEAGITTIARVESWMDSDNYHANAHLISAAPIGYNLAQAVLDNKPRKELDIIAMDFMAKAEGK